MSLVHVLSKFPFDHYACTTLLLGLVISLRDVQEKVSKPSAEQMAVLEEQFGEKQKAKQKKEEDTIEETTTLHG